MKIILSAATMAAILTYLSFHGIEINSKEYWVVSALIIVHGCVVGWRRP